ncbi:hypothetical protein JCGZ_05885 [Jatropha curcas]|uniref:Uncharacterized protein n=1 Tax=Jatropha curcas TaxID=180498 RepID=A0A067J8L9_JATCU|nr:zinc finger protein CONSTANS-LIKE 6 [Jatropha curcas]KDP20116.1 hypothetical protein JCGZ_05885 [Jatropha curcas]
MINERKAANALSGKTARACEGCSRKRARWFCAADDAFLCQSCDESVHSANQLARRHERVRLESSSFKPTVSNEYIPAWHQGFTRKARTPRHNNNSNKKIFNNNSNLPLVPEIGNEEEGNGIAADEDEDQFLYRVPVFDPFEAELCADDLYNEEEGNEIAIGNDQERINMGTDDNLDNYYLPSDMDLAEFAADVENLLGAGLDDNSPDRNNDLGFLEYCNKKQEQEESDYYSNNKFYFDEEKVVKVKNEQQMEEIVAGGCNLGQAFDQMGKEDWSFSYDQSSLVTGDEEEEEKVALPAVTNTTVKVVSSDQHKKEMKRDVSLRLNYEAVITAWASHGSPWTTGTRPELNPDDCWPDCLGTCPKDGHHHPYRGHNGGGNGGREARVLRYKEKRRTRLFSKKIRYEVRKLNAEKRPRLQGRFVKRTSFMGATFP